MTDERNKYKIRLQKSRKIGSAGNVEGLSYGRLKERH